VNQTYDDSGGTYKGCKAFYTTPFKNEETGIYGVDGCELK